MNNKNPGPYDFSTELNQTFKEELRPMLLIFFHKLETEGIWPNFFFEMAFIPILKPYKFSTKKENYKSISLIK